MTTSFKYFPVSARQKQWGVYLTDCGKAAVAPGEAYPPSQHPSGYFFTWERGRRLNEYQLLLIQAGGGTLETEGQPPRALAAGDLVLLVPGVWHRYRPDPATGWTECWIGFNGRLAAATVAEPFFPPAGTVISLGAGNPFGEAMPDLADAFLKGAPDQPYTSGMRILELLGMLQEFKLSADEDRSHTRAVRQAQFYIGRHLAETIDFEALAKRLGLGYAVFRHCFTRETSYPPLRYQLLFRLRRAKTLLANTDLSVSAIAETTGFSSSFYFSRFFRRATGSSPKSFREAGTRPRRKKKARG